jgi:membrane-bound ClpP family serine protease
MITVSYILITIAFFLIITDFFVFSYGVLTSFSAVFFVLGTIFIFLFLPVVPAFFIEIVIPAYIALLIFIAIFIYLGYKAHKSKIKSEAANIINSIGVVIKDIPKDGYGQIDLGGETWGAYAEEPVDKGKKVVIVEVDKNNIKLKVKPIS